MSMEIEEGPDNIYECTGSCKYHISQVAPLVLESGNGYTLEIEMAARPHKRKIKIRDKDQV